MRLAGIDEYRRLFFTPDSAPATSTVRAQIATGKIPGQIVAGHYYVDLDALEAQMKLSATLEQQRETLSKDPLLEGLT